MNTYLLLYLFMIWSVYFAFPLYYPTLFRRYAPPSPLLAKGGKKIWGRFAPRNKISVWVLRKYTENYFLQKHLQKVIILLSKRNEKECSLFSLKKQRNKCSFYALKRTKKRRDTHKGYPNKCFSIFGERSDKR